MKYTLIASASALAMMALASCTSVSARTAPAEKGVKVCTETGYLAKQQQGMYCRLETGDHTDRDEDGDGKLDKGSNPRGGVFTR